MRIAHNLINRFYRKSKGYLLWRNVRKTGNIFDNLRIIDDSIEERIIVDQIHEDVRRLISYLPDEQRESIVNEALC